MKKKILIITLLLILITFILSGCGKTDLVKSKEEILSAKIRYFDGSTDTVLLEWYVVLTGGSSIKLKTLEGRTVIVGINNVIIISESEEQFYNKD